MVSTASGFWGDNYALRATTPPLQRQLAQRAQITKMRLENGILEANANAAVDKSYPRVRAIKGGGNHGAVEIETVEITSTADLTNKTDASQPRTIFPITRLKPVNGDGNPRALASG